MRALCRILHEQHSSECPLLLVGFQEVINPLAPYLTAALQSAGYQWFRQPGAAVYGCAVAVHPSLRVLDHGWIPYHPTVMDRGFLYVRAQLPDDPGAAPSEKEILFTTTHLESWSGPQYTGAAQRLLQLQQMEDFCNQQLHSNNNLCLAMMSGDCNWDDERPGRSTPLDSKMSSVLSRGDDWQDSWLTSSARATKDTCYTYDGKLNPMLSGNLRRRFDRILLRPKNRVKVLSTALLGTDALPDLTWEKYNSWQDTFKTTPTAPSDHFGYLVRLQLD